MNIITALVEKLQQNTAYGVYADLAPEGVEPPFIVYSVNDTSVEYGLDGAPSLETYRIGISFIGDSSETVFQMSTDVDSVLNSMQCGYMKETGDKYRTENGYFVVENEYDVTVAAGVNVSVNFVIPWENVSNKPYIISSSAQIGDITSLPWDSVTAKPEGIVSASSQIDYNDIQNKPTVSATASYASFAEVSVSSSYSAVAEQARSVSWGAVTDKPTSILSASYADKATLADTASFVALPVGLVSASAQIDYIGIRNKPTSIQNADTASYFALPVGVVSSSAQVDYTAIQNKPTSITSASYATTASYALNVGGVNLDDIFIYSGY